MRGRPSRRRKSAKGNARARWSSETGDRSDDLSEEHCEKRRKPSEEPLETPHILQKASASERKLGAFARRNSPAVDPNLLGEASPAVEPNPCVVSAPAADTNPAEDDPEPDQGARAGFKVDYFFMHKDAFQDLIKNLLCQFCEVALLEARCVETHGFCIKFSVVCKGCGEVCSDNYTSPRVLTSATSRPPFELNHKIVQSCLSIGVGHRGLQKLSTSLGMHVMSKSNFYAVFSIVHKDSKKVLLEGLKRAHEIVREAYRAIGVYPDEHGVTDIAISYDGSWPKQGHNSLFGIGSAIDMLTGLIVDSVILSKYCSDCVSNIAVYGKDTKTYKEWQAKHIANGECEVNFEGSAAAMEREAAKILWERSIETGNFRYVKLLSDGDNKTLTYIQEADPYDGVVIEREQCVNHVSKRIVAALSNVVTTYRNRGITLGGSKEGQLTAAKILKLQNYYRAAITKNIPNVKAMSDAVMASLYHGASTDKKPRHDKCPGGEESWCFYNRALAKKLKPPKHDSSTIKTPINKVVFEAVLPVYERLSSEDLMAQCVQGQTTNPNESFHSVLWGDCSKKKFASLKRLEVNLCNAVIRFNMGHSASLLLANEVRGVETCEASTSQASQMDTARLNQATQQSRKGFTFKRKMNRKARYNTDQKAKEKGGHNLSGRNWR